MSNRSGTKTRQVHPTLGLRPVDNVEIRINLGENNTLYSGFTGEQTYIPYTEVNANGATIIGPNDREVFLQSGEAMHRTGEQPGNVTHADNLTVTGNNFHPASTSETEVFLRGFTHYSTRTYFITELRMFGENAQGLGTGATLHLGGDIITDAPEYWIRGDLNDSHLDFQFANDAQRQSFIDAFRAAGGTYNDATDTFGDATGLIWSIPQIDGDGGTLLFRDWNSLELTPLPTPVVCFTRGTLIATQKGQVAVENLKVGDMVLTSDRGYQPLRWIGSRKVSRVDVMGFPKLRPVRIEAGALGRGLPERDLLVSRQHRMLVKSRISERMFGESEVLVPAVNLCQLDGVEIDNSLTEVEYFHFLFDQHELVFAEGAASESLYLGKEGLQSLPPKSYEEITTLFPSLEQDTGVAELARLVPPGSKRKQMITRHLNNHRAVLELS